MASASRTMVKLYLSAIKDNIGDPWAEGPGYGFRPRVGIRNVIPSGAESAQKATRDDIPDPHEWSKPIFKPSAHGSPIPIFYSSSSETSESS